MVARLVVAAAACREGVGLGQRVGRRGSSGAVGSRTEMIDPESIRSSESPSGNGSVDPRDSGSNFSSSRGSSHGSSGVGWKEETVGRGGE